MMKPITEQKISDLLTYLPDYGVLLCRSCQFAVQPSAFSSHLLRHQIYRNERRKLLERLHSLAVAEPDEVTLPPSTSPPIPGLPVYRGLVCTSSECGHCCVSEKRMAQHWSLKHQRPNAQDVQARSACLQTFFRGNKNRYFEVSTNGSVSTPAGSEDTSSPTSPSSESKDILKDFRRRPPLGSEPKPFNAISQLEEDLNQRLDMLPLRLIYHWSTSTCTTVSRGNESPTFWAHNIVHEAFKHEFLMQAILSVAAYHLVQSSTESSTRAELHAAGLRYMSEGLSRYRKVLRSPPTSENSTAVIAFARLLGIQRCAEIQLQGIPEPHGEDDPVAPLLECFFLIRGGTQILIQWQDCLPEDSAFRLPPHVLKSFEDITWDQRLELQNLSGHDSLVLPPMAWFPNLSPAAYEQILNVAINCSLFNTDISPKAIDTIEDASLALMNAVNRSYESTDFQASWTGIESWAHALPDALSDEFVRMIKAKNIGILFMFAHWCLLIRRVEKHHWFMEGQSDRLLQIVLAYLDGEAAKIVKGSL